MLEQFLFVRSVRLQADQHGPAKAGHYVQVKKALTTWGCLTCGLHWGPDEATRDRISVENPVAFYGFGRSL